MSCCEGFRLAAASECSLRSKARIDALFEDSRSVCSSMAGLGWAASESGCCAEEDQQRRVNGAVQARIEAMFASVEAETGTPGECAAAVLPVKYMGAAPVGGRVASVRGLQEPLRQLVERIGESVSAELEVSRRGLTFRTSELHEKNNPFRRIAVWSALKLQARKRSSSNSNKAPDVVHAFVPLVADERMYEPSGGASNEDRHADLYRTMRGLPRDIENYPPIFAVVMRRPGAARLLECHAFACRSEEDAIAAAATLYRALLADLDAQARRPRQRNGLGCASLASVVSSLRQDTSPPSSRRRLPLPLPNEADSPIPPPPPIPAHQPVRPPRVKKHSSSNSVNTEDEQSSSSLGTTVGIVGETPKFMQKKNSDVKAEDVLEARSRSFCPPPKESATNGLINTESLHQEVQSNEERRMNAKNKIYSRRAEVQCQTVSDDVQMIEKIYDERKPKAMEVVEVYNEIEKSSSDRERSGSYDFECCTENSLYQASRGYGKTRSSLQKQQQSRIDRRSYDGSRLSGGWSLSRKSPTDSSSSNLENNSRAATRRSVEESNRRSSSISSGAARHRDHFRDVDKIYSLGAAEEHAVRLANEVYDATRPGREAIRASRAESSSNQSSRSTARRLARVATMDRPFRRASLEQINQDSSNQALRQFQHSQVQQQQQQQQPRQRRRSRAGSEPPTTRTEAAAAAAAMLKRSQSDLDLERGDLLTRVELPRRSSFLKPGSVRKREGREGGGAGTPLGFTELFDEFRNQEGLTSVDDILAAIIDPEGMSFNELKPLYKEFLLKLAATLTQDELYQRSASIMRRRRRPQRRRSSRGLLRRAIKRSVSRLRAAGGGPSSSAPTEFTSVIFPARRLNERSSLGSSASSSCEARTSSQHQQLQQQQRPGRVLASKLGRPRRGSCARRPRPGHTTSEDSDPCKRPSNDAEGEEEEDEEEDEDERVSLDPSSLLNQHPASTARRRASDRGQLTGANRSSSGYVSCSECSYDSESCTCVSADKCYCSLSRRPSQEQQPESVPPAAAAAAAAPPACSCDTDSCSESNKCYCARRSTGPPATALPVHTQRQHQQQPSILEQLRQKGIVPSESTLSRGDSPDRSRRRSARRSSRGLATSKSLEYLKVRSGSSSARGSTDNLALDYELFRPGGRRGSQCSSGSEKVLVVSARDPQGRLIYVGGAERGSRDLGRRASRRGQPARHRHASHDHHEALSIKKSAEIAAVFGPGAQLARIPRRTSSASSLRSSVSLEAGLGYLP